MDSDKNEVNIQIGTGNGKNVLIVGESPAKNGWIVSKRAFYTPDGKLLQTGKRLNIYLEPFGLTVESIGFTELVKCYVESRSLLTKLAPQYFGTLLEQISEVKPRVVITLGVITKEIFETQLNSEFPIGEIYEMEGFNYFPIYHPSPASPYGHGKNVEIFRRQHEKLEELIQSEA